MRCPVWMLDVLQRSIEPLRAEETMQQAHAAVLGMANKKSFRKEMARLQKIAQPRDDTKTLVVPANEKAREWFLMHGIPVAEDNAG